MNTSYDTEIAIVGYGPTSQLIALMLGKQGHQVTVIERWPDLYPLPRAVHFDHEIARLLQTAGVIDEVNAIVEPPGFYQWRNAQHQTLLEIDWTGNGPSGWPTANLFAQPALERVLDTPIKQLPNVKLKQGWSATSIAQDAEGVQLNIEGVTFADCKWLPTGEKETLRARYLIGADGANSTVRKALGIQVEDLGFAFDWLVVDVQPTTEREWNPKTWQLCDPVRPTTVVPGGPGRRRWEFMLLPGETPQQMNQDDVSWKLLQPWDITPDNAILERHAVYTFRGQWAEQWRDSRIMLAGDAAHLMPPFAGQGMCSGMRDSIALAWRLDAILKGKVSDDILDSYSNERSKHVQEMIGFSIELGKVICITDPEVAAARDRDMLAAQADPNFKQPAAPEARLGAGLYKQDTAGSGTLTPQGVVAYQGKNGLFDDVFGVSFALIAKNAETLQQLSEVNRKALESYGAVVTCIGESGFEDTEATYSNYLSKHQASAVLTRPDFYSYGTASESTDINALVDHWREAMHLQA